MMMVVGLVTTRRRKVRLRLKESRKGGAGVAIMTVMVVMS